MSKKVLITAGGSEVAVPIIRALKHSYQDLKIYVTETNPFSAGVLYGDKSFIVPRAENEAYEKSIIEICNSEVIDLLIPGSDTELKKLAQIKESNETNTKIVVSSCQVVDLCRNKLLTYEYLNKKSLPFSMTVYYKDIDLLMEEKGFPIIGKSLKGSGSLGVKVFFSKEEIEAHTYDKDFIFQELVTNKKKELLKKEDVLTSNGIKQVEEISIQTFVGKNGDILGLFMSENQLKQGMPVKIAPFIDHKIEAQARTIINEFIKMGLTGPFNLQGKRTKEGIVFFETNPRYTGMSGVREKMGYKEISTAVQYYLYEACEEEVKDHLVTNTDLICCRHYDEIIGEKDKVFNELEKKK